MINQLKKYFALAVQLLLLACALVSPVNAKTALGPSGLDYQVALGSAVSKSLTVLDNFLAYKVRALGCCVGADKTPGNNSTTGNNSTNPGNQSGATDAEAGLPYNHPVKSGIDPKSYELVTNHPDAHSIARHGGNVTDQQLQHRAISGVAPDGHVKYDKKTGKPIVPPMSSAFHSDRILVETDQSIRNSDIFKAKVDTLGPSETTLVLTPAELGSLGTNLGRGYKRVGPSKLNTSLQGASQKVDNLTSAQGVWKKSSDTGKWETLTLFPAEAPK